MLSPWAYVVLFLVALAAGFVDSIAGGGGLLTVPVLLHFGFPPQDTLGTNKLQACFGSGGAAWHFTRSGWVNWGECRWGVVFTAWGALTGALVVRAISPGFLRHVIPVLLVGIALFLMVRPRLGLGETSPRMRPAAFGMVFGSGIGFYDGFFGPGTGSFWAIAWVLVLGTSLVRATAHTKVMNFTSNLTALLVFLVGGNVHLEVGLVMGAGQLAGAQLGSRLVIRRGARFVRPVIIAVAMLLAAKLFYENHAG